MNNFYGVLVGIWGLLIIASLIVYFMTNGGRNTGYKELVDRTKSWWYMLAIFTLAMVLNRNISVIFLGIMCYLAFKEYITMIPTRIADRRVLFWAYIAIIIQFYFVWIGWYGMFILFIPVYMFLFIPFRMILGQETKGFLTAAGSIHWGLMLTVFALSHTAFLLMLSPDKHVGAGLLLFVVFLTQANDVAQYVWGKLFGKTKIIPKVSPKKTWEGFLGGACTTLLLGLCIYSFLTPFSFVHALCAGLIIAVGGFLGDVTISAIKRDLGVKDAGQLIPGHGGILDRVDSLIFTAPLFLHFTRYFYF